MIPVPAQRVAHEAFEGDNLDVMKLLVEQGRTFDTIYIDPPYNTGLDNLGYPDTFSSHLAWRQFMEPRLHLAAKLLAPTGVFLCSIGHEEHHYLKVLADRVFGESNFIADITWHGASKGSARFVSNGSEYLLAYAADLPSLKRSGARWRMPKAGVTECFAQARQCLQDASGDTEKASVAYRAWMRSEKLPWALRNYDTIDADGQPFYAQPLNKPVDEGPRYEVLHPRTGQPCRVPSKGWRFSRERFETELAAGRVLFGFDHTVSPRVKSLLADQATVVPSTVFEHTRRGGARHLEKLGIEGLRFAKDHEALAAWIGAVTPNDGKVLDFFAGSGSTAEAVIRLNLADGGTRTCTLVEDGLFETVLKPRMAAVLTGQRADGKPTGFGAVHDQELRLHPRTEPRTEAE